MSLSPLLIETKLDSMRSALPTLLKSNLTKGYMLFFFGLLCYVSLYAGETYKITTEIQIDTHVGGQGLFSQCVKNVVYRVQRRHLGCHAVPSRLIGLQLCTAVFAFVFVFVFFCISCVCQVIPNRLC